ncbi:MAG: hypothetical protein IV100_12245 [Myxococcales bacterium]|nr:hypothetical protein [Myxococcales bacterium]
MKTKADPEMLPEYDFSKGTRGKFAVRYRAGSNVVVIEDDLATSFPTAESVNAALRRQLEVERAARAT